MRVSPSKRTICSSRSAEFRKRTFCPMNLSIEMSEGLYFVGDVKNGLYRQAAIAAGDGLRAAMQIYHSLEEGSI